MDAALFARADQLQYNTTDAARIGAADRVVVAVPTPVDDAHQPDLTPMIKAADS